VAGREETIWVGAVTCKLLKEWDLEAVLRKTPFWATEGWYSREDGRPGWLAHPDVLIDHSLLGTAPLEGAAHIGQIHLLRAVVLAVRVEEVTGVQVQAFGHCERGSLRSGNLEDVVFVPCRRCWSCLYFAGADAKAHMVAAVATLTAILAARAGLGKVL
jgi:hypothetical protein